MVRLQFLGDNDFVQLTMREVFQYLPEAHYDLPRMPIQNFFLYALRSDPVFKIQSIPENELYLNDGKLKFTRFEFMSVRVRPNNKRWLDYKIFRPSSFPDKRCFSEGPISCIEKPPNQAIQLKVEQLKEHFTGAIIIIPITLNMINTSRIVQFKRFDKCGYNLRVRSNRLVNNNGSNNEEEQISNSGLERPVTRRSTFRLLKFTEQHMIFSSIDIATTMPLPAINEDTQILNETAESEMICPEASITEELPSINEDTQNLNETAESEMICPEASITESPKRPKLSSSVIKPKPKRLLRGETPECGSGFYIFSDEEIAIVDNILKSMRKNDSPNKSQDLATGQLEKPPTSSVTLSEKSPTNPSSSMMENQLPELLHSPSESSIINGSVSEEPKKSPSNITVDQQQPELSPSTSIKFDVSVSVGSPKKSLSFSVMEKELPKLLPRSSASSSTFNGFVSVENGDSNMADKSQNVNDAVNMVLKNIQGKINEAASTELETSDSTETNYVAQLKTLLESRSIMNATYSIKCSVVKPMKPFRYTYSCKVKLYDFIIGNSFPLECTSPEQAMQVAAKIAFDHIQKCDSLSLSIFFYAQTFLSFQNVL